MSIPAESEKFINPEQMVQGVNDKAVKKITGWKGMFYPLGEFSGDNVVDSALSEIKRGMIQALNDDIDFGKLRKIPNILGIYLGEFVALHQGSIENLAQLALLSVIKPDIKYRINIGFGGTVDPVLARCPAYIVPAVKILEGLSGAGVPLPEVRIFSTQSLISLNGRKLEDVGLRTDEMFALLADYIREFHPNIKSFFSFEKPQINLEEVSKFAEHIGDVQDPTIQKALNEIQQMGFHHGGVLGRNNANLYAAAHIHPQFFQDVLPAAEDSPDFVVSLGGKPEIQFNLVRVGLIEQLRSARVDTVYFPHSVHAIVGIGEKPVYYQDSWNDITAEDFVSKPDRLKGVSPRVKVDLQAIFDDVGEERYRQFLEERQK